MDGNGRWGLKNKNSRNAGHKAGLNTVEKIIKQSIKYKIKYLTLYAFSTENWKRPKKEIDYLFSLLETFVIDRIEELHKQNIKLKIIGIKKFSPKLNQLLSKSEKKTFKNYIKVQESFNKKNSLQFLKTHSVYFNYQQKHSFSNFDNSLGVIYIVRDPRNVVSSFSKFKNLSHEEASDFIIRGVGDQLTWTSNWSQNFNSWKFLKDYNKYLLVKYEDLINNRELIFLNILKFIYKLNKTKFTLDEKKFENVIKTTDFMYMQKLEKELWFLEANIDEKTGNKIPFFNLGPKNDWKKNLDDELKKKLNSIFQKSLVELNY